MNNGYTLELIGYRASGLVSHLRMKNYTLGLMVNDTNHQTYYPTSLFLERKLPRSRLKGRGINPDDH